MSGDAVEGVRGGVVVDDQVAVGGVGAKCVPLVEGVGNGLARGALGHCGAAVGRLEALQPGFQLCQPRDGELLAKFQADLGERAVRPPSATALSRG